MSSKREPRSGYIGIHRSEDGQFYALYYAEGNREPLAPSETLKSKQLVKKNIKAMARLFKGVIPRVVDYTLENPKVILLKD